MGLINRFRKLNSRTSFSLGKMQIGGLPLAFILIVGFGWMFIRHKLDLAPETYELVNEIVGLAIATLFVSIVVVKLSRLSSRNRWAMVCIFGCASLVGVLAGVFKIAGDFCCIIAPPDFEAEYTVYEPFRTFDKNVPYEYINGYQKTKLYTVKDLLNWYESEIDKQHD